MLLAPAYAKENFCNRGLPLIATNRKPFSRMSQFSVPRRNSSVKFGPTVIRNDSLWQDLQKKELVKNAPYLPHIDEHPISHAKKETRRLRKRMPTDVEEQKRRYVFSKEKPKVLYFQRPSAKTPYYHPELTHNPHMQHLLKKAYTSTASELSLETNDGASSARSTKRGKSAPSTAGSEYLLPSYMAEPSLKDKQIHQRVLKHLKADGYMLDQRLRKNWSMRIQDFSRKAQEKLKREMSHTLSGYMPDLEETEEDQDDNIEDDPKWKYITGLLVEEGPAIGMIYDRRHKQWEREKKRQEMFETAMLSLLEQISEEEKLRHQAELKQQQELVKRITQETDQLFHEQVEQLHKDELSKPSWHGEAAEFTDFSNKLWQIEPHASFETTPDPSLLNLAEISVSKHGRKPIGSHGMNSAHLGMHAGKQAGTRIGTHVGTHKNGESKASSTSSQEGTDGDDEEESSSNSKFSSRRDESKSKKLANREEKSSRKSTGRKGAATDPGKEPQTSKTPAAKTDEIKSKDKDTSKNEPVIGDREKSADKDSSRKDLKPGANFVTAKEDVAMKYKGALGKLRGKFAFKQATGKGDKSSKKPTCKDPPDTSREAEDSLADLVTKIKDATSETGEELKQARHRMWLEKWKEVHKTHAELMRESRAMFLKKVSDLNKCKNAPFRQSSKYQMQRTGSKVAVEAEKEVKHFLQHRHDMAHTVFKVAEEVVLHNEEKQVTDDDLVNQPLPWETRRKENVEFISKIAEDKTLADSEQEVHRGRLGKMLLPWESLRCGYLRLTKGNVDNIEQLAKKVGRPIGIHRHMTSDDVVAFLDNKHAAKNKFKVKPSTSADGSLNVAALAKWQRAPFGNQPHK